MRLIETTKFGLSNGLSHGLTAKLFLISPLSWLHYMLSTLNYMETIQVLDLRSWTWSKIEAKVADESTDSSSSVTLTPCAGHTLVCIENDSLNWKTLHNLICYIQCVVSLFLVLILEYFGFWPLKLCPCRFHGKISFCQLLGIQKILTKVLKLYNNS